MQCAYVANAIDGQCGRDALLDSPYCAAHQRGNNRSGIQHKDFPKMTVAQRGFYTSRIGPKLRDVVNEYRENSKVHDITEEVELTRIANLAAVQQFEVIQLQLDCPAAWVAAGGGVDDESQERGKAILREMLIKAAENLKDAMRENARMVEMAAKIHNLTVDKMSPDLIESLVRQICGMVHSCFGEHWHLIERFDKMIAEKLQLPSVLNAMGTRLSPSNAPSTTDEVRAMISTVPEWTEEDERQAQATIAKG